MPYLKCIDEEEAKYILKKIHEGICSNHAGPRSLVGKVIKIGYFLAYFADGCKGVRQEM